MEAQFEDSTFVRYTIKDGLSDNYITALQQDDMGYLWIGTDNGLNRFDGYSFSNFYQGSANLPLPSNTIWKLKSFGDHQLGIISLRGFQVVNTKDFTLTNYFVPDSTAFTIYANYALDAVPLPGYSFALATASGFYAFDKKGTLFFRHDKYTAADIDKKRILYARKIIPLNDKEYIVYVEKDGIAVYNAGKKTFAEISATDFQWQQFYHPAAETIGTWIDQFMMNEFIFIHQKKDSIVYYDRRLKKTVASPLPFKLDDELDFTSKIIRLDENSFAVNSLYRGFHIFHLDRQSGRIVFDPKRYLAEYRVSCLFLDKDNKLWVGTRKGLLHQKQSSLFIKSYHYPVASPDKPVPGFADGFRYKDKLYLARFSRYYGLVIADTATMKIEKRIQFYGSNTMWNEIYSMQMYHPDTLWLGTNSGLLWFDIKSYHYGKVLDEKKYPAFISEMPVLGAAGKDGYAWFCYFLSGAVGRYHIPTRSFTFFTSETMPALPFNKVKSVAIDAYGDVWFGGHALARWNSKKQVFDTLIKVYGGVNKFNDDILTLTADDKGSLWLHNTDNGLLEYRIKDKKFVSYSMSDGLPSAQIRCTSPVVGNMLWMATVNFLAGFNTLTKKTIVYDQRDGLPEEFPSSRKIYFDKEREKFYLFCGDYLAEFPLALQTNPSLNNRILIQELIVNNKNSFHHPADTVRLSYNENNLSLLFNIINFESPGSYRFEYRLNNADSWTVLASQRSINLNQLQPGKYITWIKAIDKFGEETTKEFTIIIKPPFWKTTWFLAGIGLLIAAIIWLIYKYRITQIRQRANLDKQLAQTEMKALHSQMNPHFVFNSLNSIREMILNNENKEASHYLSKFARLIRITLEQSGQSFISLRNTIDYLHRYMEMEKIRNTHFTYTLNADESLDLDETVLPPMLIQPFIENAIWHGVTATRKNINIRVSFGKEKEQLVCTVEDDGTGINQSLKNKTANESQHQSVGISNVENHIRLLNEKYNLRCSVTIKDKQDIPGSAGPGTLVTLHLPNKLQEE
jgi:ligand-binding sensor domain-containing protein/two-component sensor histidine kinase